MARRKRRLSDETTAGRIKPTMLVARRPHRSRGSGWPAAFRQRFGRQVGASLEPMALYHRTRNQVARMHAKTSRLDTKAYDMEPPRIGARGKATRTIRKRRVYKRDARGRFTR